MERPWLLTCETCRSCKEHQTEIGVICIHTANASPPGNKPSVNKHDKACKHWRLAFPKLDCGWCDGMGCSNSLITDPRKDGDPCWCSEYLAMREEFQIELDMAWDDKNPICQVWESAWRFGTSRYSKFYEECRKKD